MTFLTLSHLKKSFGATQVVHDFNMAIDKGAFPPHVLEEYRKNALIPGALTAMINYYRANLKILEETSPPIDVPTLMLWGEEDTALDPYGAQSPDEFFAVASEAFFVHPQAMRHEHAALAHEGRSALARVGRGAACGDRGLHGTLAHPDTSRTCFQ